jgi:hypothetical protein
MKCHRFRRAAMPVQFAVFYFDEHDRFIILHDQVNFPKATGKIPFQQREAMVQQKSFGSFLPLRP